MRKAAEERGLQLISRPEGTFVAPVMNKDTTIMGIRRWEQAFRVYAAVYSKANPHRSAETWQYVYVINSAAAYYIWDNVS